VSDARVIHQYIEPAPGLDEPVEKRIYLGLARDIDRSARLIEPPRDRSHLIAIDVS
jgi:hypothetical protein